MSTQSNNKRRLIVACGSGVATSQTIASKVKSMLQKDGIDYPVDAVDYKSIKTELKNASIYLYIAKPDDEVLEKAKELGVNVFAGVPFLTGMGLDAIYSEIKKLTK
ncbi:PTS sugar transporter subunit IIB [Lactovum odontotermitis]